MLVLNRKIGESLIIDVDIEVTILDIQDGKIKLGIEAPKDISILRKEVYDEVKNENEASLNTGDYILNVLKKMK